MSLKSGPSNVGKDVALQKALVVLTEGPWRYPGDHGLRLLSDPSSDVSGLMVDSF